MSKQQTKKRNSFYDRPIVGLILLLLLNVLFIGILFQIRRYIQIHSQYFIMGIGVAMVIVLSINLMALLGYAKNIRFFRKLTMVVGVIVLLVGSVGGFYLFRANSLIDKIIDPTSKEIVEYSVISFDKTKDETMMDGASLGYVKSTDEGLEPLIKETIQPYSRTVDYKGYESDKDLLLAGLEGEIQFAVLPKSYTHLGEQVADVGNPFENSKRLFTFSSKIQGNVSNVDVVNEPFSILMIGVNEGLSDSLIFATYNPKTLKITMTSISRDSYVPIACRGGVPDKINHSSGISRQCLLDTVEDFLDEPIDFFFEADFYALVKIVDALGGLDIESPTAFAGSYPLEDQFDDNGEPVYEAVHVPAGLNHLDGKQTLTFARERKNMPGGDFDRQMNQQYVIKEVATKILATRNPNTLLDVLDAAKDNITTNLPMNSISALMGHALQSMDSSPLTPMETFRFSQMQIAGEGYNPGVWYSIPYASQVRNARVMIDLNMEVELKLRGDKGFEFTYLKPYDALEDNPEFEENLGELWYGNDYSIDRPQTETETETEVEKPREPEPEEQESTTVRVIDLSGMSDSEIQAWASSNGLNVSFATVDKIDDGTFTQGQFWSQSTLSGEELEKGSTITIHRINLVPGEEKPEDEDESVIEGENQDSQGNQE